MSNADWWARRLNAPPPPRELTPTAYAPPVPAPAENAKAARAQRTHNQGRCPECDSDNYFSATTGVTKTRCFECGYPVKHTTSGMGNALGQSTASRQNNPKGVSHFEPQTIVGRVG